MNGLTRGFTLPSMAENPCDCYIRAMGFALRLAIRYMRSRRRGFVSLSTVFAIVGVALGTAALVAVMSVTGGFRAQFQKKVLGVNGHVIVLRSPFRDYRDVLEKVRGLPGVLGVSPFLINPMMMSHGARTVTGITVKGVDPRTVGSVLDLPEQMVEGSLDGLEDTAGPERSPAHATGADAATRVTAAGDTAGRWSPRAERDAGSPGAPRIPARDLTPGSIVPADGYASTLPDSDELPQELDPDPCLTAHDLPGIVVGLALKQALNLSVGTCVQVTSPTIGYSFAGGEMRPPVAKQFKVSGVFHAGFEQYDTRFAYTSLAEAQAFYRDGDSVTGVEIKVADVDRAREMSLRVNEELGDRLYTVIDWMQLNGGLFTALRIQQILMSLVLGLIILVAAFTVVATLVMVVLAKKKEIAAVKAMGASDTQVLRAFLYQGFFIGAAGTASGLSVGYVLCRWILTHGFPLDPKVYFIDRLPVQIRWHEFALTGAFAMVACLVATLWPALHAARLRPVDAFRGS
jgi:lipoprotein-releasing system permease protein